MPSLSSQASFFTVGPPARIGEAHAPILEFLAREVRGRVLDLGGGCGAYACALRDLGHDVVLAEINPESLGTAREHGLETIDMNGVSLSSLVGKFETIQLVEVLEHIDDPAAFLAEVLGCAGRQVLLSIPCSNDFQALFAANLTYAHVAVTDHRWHFTDAEVRALFPPQWEVEIELTDFLGPAVWMGMLSRTCKSRRLWLWATYPLRVLQRRGLLERQFPTRMLVKAVRK